MVWTGCITLPLLATVVLADYYIDNANASVVYYPSEPSEGSGVPWQTLYGSQLMLQFENSTGNYSIPINSSFCYDQNYALAVCGTNDDCSVHIPFSGSGITMYVFNAGISGMAAGFSVDGDGVISNSIDPPGSENNYQVSNVSLYDIQDLPSGNHTLLMSLLDWNGSPTDMKFDYAYVNEAFVAAPTTTSSAPQSTQASTQTSTANPSVPSQINVTGIVGGTLGAVVVLGCVVFGFHWLRNRRAARPRHAPSEPTLPVVVPFTSEAPSRPPPHTFKQPGAFRQRPSDGRPTVGPLARSALLRDAHAAGTPVTVLQPRRRPPSMGVDHDSHAHPTPAAEVVDQTSPFADSPLGPRYALTQEEAEVIHRLRADNVPAGAVARVIEGLLVSPYVAEETEGERGHRAGSVTSSAPPPSYQTLDR